MPLDIPGCIGLREFWLFVNSAIVLGTPRVCDGAGLVGSNADGVEGDVWGFLLGRPRAANHPMFFVFVCVRCRKAASPKVDTGVLNTLVSRKREPVLHPEVKACDVSRRVCRFSVIFCCAKVCV